MRYNRSVRHSALDRVHRIIVAIIVLALAGIAVIGAQVAGYGLPDANGLPLQGLDLAAYGTDVALISGHRGNDSGAVCEDADGIVTLTEADVNARVSELTAERLRKSGSTVTILDEYDSRLTGLRTDVLLSLHADSCIEQSGFKAAYYAYTTSPAADERLLGCLNAEYAAVTGLPQHPNTVTHNMTEYHAFRKIAESTPAVILELGFLGGDKVLLEGRPEVVAQGVANGILCYLRGDASPTPVPTLQPLPSP